MDHNLTKIQYFLDQHLPSTRSMSKLERCTPFTYSKRQRLVQKGCAQEYGLVAANLSKSMQHNKKL